MARKVRAPKTRSHGWGCLRWGIASAGLLFLLCGVLLTLLTRQSLAARGADILRSLIGDEPVAGLEMLFFKAQDAVQKITYAAGLEAPQPPWKAVGVAPTPTLVPTLALVYAPTPTPAPALSEQPVLPTPTAPAVLPTPAPAASPTPSAWQPAPVTPLGDLEGEGQWSPYLWDAEGRAVAYRAFLQPDPTRPFAVVAVIAFDLERTRLHYILGFQEPNSPGIPPRTGAMPETDKAPHRLLAMFNGGFKTTHGKFGAMSGGLTAIPPRDGLGALVIYQDGRVRMGVWGQTIQPSDDMQAWRQNGPLVVQDGQINPRIYNNSPKDWGYTVNDVSPTWRSGIGLSKDGQALYYFAGSSLTMEALAQSMLAAGAADGMQLDINAYWVHFVAVHDENGQRSLEPLFPKMMKENIDRYLHPYSRDYFYVTAGE